ncbi:MAG: hypothetical protein ACLFU0_08175 [Alphaproteobacteria bacterium]
MSSSASISAVARRDPSRVMRLARLGSLHPCRLSFARVMLRRLAGEGWRLERQRWSIDDAGSGTAVYTAAGPERSYSLVAVAPPRAAPTRRAASEIAFVLVDGVADGDDLARLTSILGDDGATRLGARDLCLVRARRSTRLFEPLVARLAAGAQPALDAVERTGYALRTISVHASGKLGSADRDQIAERGEFAAPYQVEMLTLYLIRAFALDLVDHLAACRAPRTAVALARERRRRLGVGNATGPGLAPFFINHPLLADRWFGAREEAIARVRGLERASVDARRVFRARLADARDHVASWQADHPPQAAKIRALAADLAHLTDHVDATDLAGRQPWDELWRWAEGALGLEGQELLASLLMEPYGELVDELAGELAVDERAQTRLDGRMRVAELRATVARLYDWALAIDFADPDARAQVWYADTTGEARVGPRQTLDPAVERPCAPARDVQALARALEACDGDATVAAFVLRHPEHRCAVRRVQIARAHPYAEIRDNTLDADLLPVDLLRAKLAFMGATRFDPRSDRWVRVTFFQGAPLADELESADADGWIYATPPAAHA